MDPNQTMITNEGEPSSNSTKHENVAISISQLGMIFGNLPFEPILDMPLTVHGKSQEAKVKTEVFTDEDNLATGFKHYFYCEKHSTTAPTIQIKQEEYDWEATVSEARKNEAVCDSNRVLKRKRSRLPQYTLSPLARFINHLRHVSRYGRRPFNKAPYANRADKGGPKYDDVLIYEKCTKFVPENEIGLGAKLLLPPPPPAPPVCSTMVVVKEEPY